MGGWHWVVRIHGHVMGWRGAAPAAQSTYATAGRRDEACKTTTTTSNKGKPTTTRLDEANLVGNVERVVVGRQADIRLLLAVRAVFCT